MEGIVVRSQAELMSWMARTQTSEPRTLSWNRYWVLTYGSTSSIIPVFRLLAIAVSVLRNSPRCREVDLTSGGRCIEAF